MHVPLAHKHFGTTGKPPMVVIHGLLGSARNWLTVGRDLSEHFDVYALDLRNHGDSPHSAVMDYEALVADVLAWIQGQSFAQPPVVVGHSLGGKTTMALACRHPESLAGIVVADIAPKDNPAMLREFEAMEALPIHSLKSRAEAEAHMAEAVPSLGMRRFLLTNLVRASGGTGFVWSVNLPVLIRSLASMAANPLEDSEHYTGKALFIRGGKSEFVPDDIWAQTQAYFPCAELVTLPEAGHNVHVDDRAGFVEAVQAVFL